MNRFFTILTCILALLTFAGCEYVVSPASRLEHFVNRVDLHGTSMTEKEWEEADNQLQGLQKDLDENSAELSEQEILHLNIVMSRYNEIRMRYELAKKSRKN